MLLEELKYFFNDCISLKVFSVNFDTSSSLKRSSAFKRPGRCSVIGLTASMRELQRVSDNGFKETGTSSKRIVHLERLPAKSTNTA